MDAKVESKPVVSKSAEAYDYFGHFDTEAGKIAEKRRGIARPGVGAEGTAGL